jgi:hypothetical protein
MIFTMRLTPVQNTESTIVLWPEISTKLLKHDTNIVRR